MTAIQVSSKVQTMLDEGNTAEQVLAAWPKDSRNYHRAWGCLVAKGLITDPELTEMMEGFRPVEDAQ